MRPACSRQCAGAWLLMLFCCTRFLVAHDYDRPQLQSMLLQVSQPSSLVSLGPQGFVSSFVAFASNMLNISSSLIAVTDFVLAPGARLAADEATVGMVVDFVVTPPDSYSPDQV